jgi:hypothetical protein
MQILYGFSAEKGRAARRARLNSPHSRSLCLNNSMTRRHVLPLLVWGMMAAHASGQVPEGNMQPFEMIWQIDEAGGPVLADVSFLLEAPAGKHGFVQVKNGRLADGRGARLRIWGVNFSFTASLPDKESAPKVAAHLARFGVNCVRVHHLDWRTPRGIIDSRYPDSQHLDPEMFDRLDYLIAELKKRGIYTNLNMNVARAFQEADGVKDWDQLGFAKAVTYFDPRLIELQKDFMRQMLTHRNPYTGNEYREEPAIAMVEILNENSLMESWKAGRLQGKEGAPKADATWRDIPPSYARDLDVLWEKAGGQGPRLKPEEFAAAPAERFRQEAWFLMELEKKFFLEMQNYLQETLGVRMPVVGTSAHNGGMSHLPLISSTSLLDIVDGHVYWQHPSYGVDAATGRRTFEIRNTPMVNEPARSTPVTLNRNAVAGKPYIVSEVGHPYPAEYAAEGIPILAAYGALQDWDGIFWYSFEHAEAAKWVSKYPSHFDIRQDPVKMSQLAAAAVVFLRGDLSPARKTALRSYTREQVADSFRLDRKEAPNFTAGMDQTEALRTGSRIASLDAKQGTRRFPSYRGAIESDTRHLRWLLDKQGQGLVRVDTPRAQMLVGFVKDHGEATNNLSAAIDNPFAAVMLVSLDGKAISSSSRLLLTAGARTGNTGMKWNEKRTTLLETGTGPMTIEPVAGMVQLNGLEGVKRVDAWPLDGAGRKLGPAITGKKTLNGWGLPLGDHVTPWYVLDVLR